ncbi:hypothetical protein OB2597_01182 [Pseudooceanicola batsensis HTCC2597]|uniref:AsmA-like C-terminal domain-containing protein n=1 Tax=Pseudooceanicola batsensis (strain ATCC BAA-863 / DSM 15984 / KCTC 12145 / HTCC2597) TaxID=252305 RepID=A3U2S9_PSEBH|nr:AsmA-like C-terminal region-containing protein [Pseudooceanicola batsensis]EAQ01459.1 hypothetical protein OB2597_01182 [Pseudooceanicola batsensis HTCC2597]
MTETADPDPGPPAAPRRRRRRRLIHWGLAVLLVPPMLAGLAVLALLWSARGTEYAAPDWLKQRIEARVAGALPGTSMEFADLTLTVTDSWQPSLRLTDVRIMPLAGGDPVLLSDVTGSFDAEALLDGQVRPRVVTVTGARINVHRDEDGEYGVALGMPGGVGANNVARDLAQTLRAVSDLFDYPVFASLRRIEGAGLTVQYEDRQSRRSWTVDGGRLALEREADALRLRGDFALLGGHSYATTIELSATAAMHSSAAALTLLFEDAAARDIASQSAGLVWLGVLDAPISGALRVSTNEDGALGPLNGTLRIGSGAVAPNASAEPIPFDAARTYFRYEPEARTLTFSEISVESAWVEATAEGRVVLGDITGVVPEAMTGQLRITDLTANPAGIYPTPLFLEGAETEMRIRFDPFRLELGRLDLRDRGETLRLAGWFDATPEGWDISMTGHMAELTADDLLELWPTGVLAGTREWVARNVLNGVMRNFQLGVRSRPRSRPDVMLGFDFENLITTFARTMPPIESASGHVEMRDDRFVVTADAGRLYTPNGEGLDITGTSFIYENIHVKRGPAEVRVNARGPLTDVLRLIDSDPLNLLSNAGRTPDIARGTAELSARLNFDLVKNLPAEAVEVAYAARVTDVESDVIVPNMALTAERLDISGTGRNIEVSGEARIDGIPVGGTWTADFAPGGPGGSRLEGWLAFDRAAAERLNLGLPPGAVDGRTRARVTLEMARDRPPEFTLTSDLQGLAVAIDALNWRKSRGQSAALDVAGSLGAPPRIDSIRLSAPGLNAAGSVTLHEGGALDSARFDRVQVGGWIDAPVRITGRGKGVPPRIAVGGGTLDLRELPAGGGAGDTGPITLTLDRLQVSDAIAIRGLRAELAGRGGLSGQFAGRVNGTAPISGTLVPRNGRSAIRITSDNAGAVLAAAGLLGQGRSGALDLTLNPAGPRGSYDGLLKVSNIWLQDAPAMASLLSALSIVGLLEQMSGRGILFSDVEADFRLTPDQLVLRRSSAVGASMGISMDGIYDLGRKTMDMQGVVSPVYMINGIGQIFSRKGEGLLGFNYLLRGPAANPRVTVNPLSIFTPGMFREIFRRPPPTTN